MSGDLLTISEKSFASIATLPFSMISPSTIVSIPSSMSLLVNLITLVVASINMHSKIFIVVRVGTAFITIPTALLSSLFENTSFIIV